MSEPLVLGVSEFVAVFNQTISYAYPSITIEGELSSLRVSKNRWLYFDLKDDESSVKFFGTVYQLPGPLEDGMVLRVTGTPQLHPRFGFSINVQSIQLAGEGTIKKAAKLLESKLRAEGLFDPSRKRSLPYPPSSIGLITSGQSAAYADFIKIINARWQGLDIKLFDVQVQGQDSPTQIAQAFEYFNSHAEPPEVLVITRGGGSADDLQAFNTEQVVRAVAASRIPTVVAIGHEVDMSLAELAADMRASTPSNAAELLVPDKKHELIQLKSLRTQLSDSLQQTLRHARQQLRNFSEQSLLHLTQLVSAQRQMLSSHQVLLNAMNPSNVLKRGYALVRKNGKLVRSANSVKPGDNVYIQIADGQFGAEVK